MRIAEAANREAAQLTGRPLGEALDRWHAALAAPDSAGAPADAARAAAELQSHGRRLQAAEAYSDAALLAQSQGQPGDEWRQRATELYATCSAVPLLDLKPELERAH